MYLCDSDEKLWSGPVVVGVYPVVPPPKVTKSHALDWFHGHFTGLTATIDTKKWLKMVHQGIIPCISHHVTSFHIISHHFTPCYGFLPLHLPFLAQDAAPSLPEKLRGAEQQQLCEALRQASENPEEMPEAQRNSRGNWLGNYCRLLVKIQDIYYIICNCKYIYIYVFMI